MSGEDKSASGGCEVGIGARDVKLLAPTARKQVGGRNRLTGEAAAGPA